MIRLCTNVTSVLRCIKVQLWQPVPSVFPDQSVHPCQWWLCRANTYLAALMLR